MDLNELKQYTNLREVCIDIRSLSQYPGWVRKITFFMDNEVCIEFMGSAFSEEESGFKYCCVFASLDEAVESIEDYLDSPIQDWHNYTKSGIISSSAVNLDSLIGEFKLSLDILENKVELPKRGYFEPLMMPHFTSIEECNDYYQKILADERINHRFFKPNNTELT